MNYRCHGCPYAYQGTCTNGKADKNCEIYIDAMNEKKEKNNE